MASGCLAKMFESLVNTQLWFNLSLFSVLTRYQTGFMPQNSITSGRSLVLNDISVAVDSKMSCCVN